MMRFLILLIASATAFAQPQNITLVKEVPGGVLVLGTVGTPTASPGAGSVSSGAAVTFSTATSGATIRWLSDGGTPTCFIGNTTNPVTITVDTTFKVIACKDNYLDSAVATLAYTVATATTARAFNGSGSNLSNTTCYLSGATSFTIAMWVKSSNTAQTDKYLLNKINAGNSSSIIYGYAGSVVEFINFGGTGTSPRTGSQIAISNTSWHHIAYRYNGTEWAYFLDGAKTVINANITFALSAGTSSCNNFVGASGAGGADNNFAGSVARVVMSSSALTDGQIAALAGTCSSSGISGTVGYWQLLGDASPEPESSPSPNTNSLSLSAGGVTKDNVGPICAGQ